MMKGSFIKDDELEVHYNISNKQKDLICERLLKYYKENCHYGEGIHQDDDSLIEAPSVLSDICDNIINFREVYTENE